MGNLNYIVFGGIDSRDYGIYISGEGVFNAPERDVEVVNIPGKDGDLLIDRGRFLNIQVTYPGFNFEPDLSTFAERLRAFRAALTSQIGYQRLEDSFHPDEFRLASFRSGLDVKPVMYNTASTFDIVFDCKPQRFLKSGEEEITIGQWGETETVSGSIATFEAESNTGIKSLVVDIEPIQSGTGDPSPSNIRPISGTNTVNVTVSGINLWDEEWIRGIMYSNGSASAEGNGIMSKNFCPFLPNTQYYSNQFVCWYDIDKTFISRVGAGAKTSPSNAYYFKITTADGYGTTYNNDIVVNYPATDTEYHAHQGSTITKSLGQTVYGGTLDLVSGKLIIDSAKIVLDGTQDIWLVNWLPRDNSVGWLYGGDLIPFKEISDWEQTPNLVADRLKTESYYHLYNNDVAGIGLYTNTVYSLVVRSNDTSLTTVDAINSYLSANPITVVYELATPQIIQLTPTEVKTLLGTNNIWADSGEVSVEYGADPNILVNPTPFEALPLIEVVGVGSLTVGNITMTITGDSTQDIFIDSDIMEAYEDDNGAIISRNDRISLSGMHFPTLGTDTGITYTGLTSVTVTPRWWTI